MALIRAPPGLGLQIPQKNTKLNKPLHGLDSSIYLSKLPLMAKSPPTPPLLLTQKHTEERARPRGQGGETDSTSNSPETSFGFLSVRRSEDHEQ